MTEVLELARLMKERAKERPELLKGMPIHDYMCHNSTPEAASLFLNSLVKHLKPKNCLEIGTCLGLSTLFIVDALNRNGNGSLVTIDKNADSVKIAKELLAVTDAEKIVFMVGKTKDILKPALEAFEEVDFCYIDGEHKMETVLFEFGQVFAKLSAGGVIVLDDVIAYSDEMREAWAEIKQREGVFWAEHERKFGIVSKTPEVIQKIAGKYSN